MQRADWIAALHGDLGLFGFGASPVGGNGEKCVEIAPRLHARQHRLHRLDRGNRLVADRGGEIAGGEIGNVGHDEFALRSDHPPAAVDEQRLPGDVARVVAARERRRSPRHPPARR